MEFEKYFVEGTEKSSTKKSCTKKKLEDPKILQHRGKLSRN